MSQGRTPSRQTSITDDYPRRPSNLIKNEINQLNSKIEKKETYVLVLLSITYFIYGSGISIYGPLYPEMAKVHRIKSYIYGSSMAANFLTSILFYPIACRMVTSITCRQSMCMSLLVIGVCKVLFGTLKLVSASLPFVLLSYAIQVIEGFGLSTLLASSFVSVFSQTSEKIIRNTVIIVAFLILGLSIGPILGEALNKIWGFSAPFYGLGILTVLYAIPVAILLPEPDIKINHTDMSISPWIRKPRMVIYCLIVFTTLHYAGFLSVVMEPYLRRFHLNQIFVGALFSISPFACGVSAFGWKWIMKKGMNSLLLICIASLLTFASIILIGPVPFIHLAISLENTSIALLLNGFATGGKLACVAFAADRDLRSNRNLNGVVDPLIIPTMFAFGSLLGYFMGLVTAGLSYVYLGMGQASYILMGLEAVTVVVTFVFAFKRNYASPRHINASAEQTPILQT